MSVNAILMLPHDNNCISIWPADLPLNSLSGQLTCLNTHWETVSGTEHL
jgi:hypothetical protein